MTPSIVCTAASRTCQCSPMICARLNIHSACSCAPQSLWRHAQHHTPGAQKLAPAVATRLHWRRTERSGWQAGRTACPHGAQSRYTSCLSLLPHTCCPIDCREEPSAARRGRRRRRSPRPRRWTRTRRWCTSSSRSAPRRRRGRGPAPRARVQRTLFGSRGVSIEPAPRACAQRTLSASSRVRIIRMQRVCESGHACNCLEA